MARYHIRWKDLLPYSQIYIPIPLTVYRTMSVTAGGNIDTWKYGQ